MRTTVVLAIVLALVALSGCASRPLLKIPADRPLPAHKQLESVPFFAQDEYQCGPAALAMMLNSQGLDTTPEDLRERVYLPGRKGSLQVEMVAAARQHGHLVYPLEQELGAILREVAAGHPVLVLQNLGFGWWPRWHFAVVIGYDLAREELILHSGRQARKRVAFATFANTWARGGRWARTILPPGQIPATAEPLAYLRAAYDLEKTGQAPAAARAYQAAVASWPTHRAARFALANHALSLGHNGEARDQFRKLLERHPRFAPAWNNLAVALARSDCAHVAERAQACARKLAPDDSRFEIERTQESGLDKEAPGKCYIPECPIPVPAKASLVESAGQAQTGSASRP